MLLVPKWAAESTAKLIMPHDSPRQPGSVAESVVGIEHIVAEEFISGTVELISPGPSDDINLPAHGAPVLRRRNRADYGELLNGFIRRLEVDHAVLPQIHRHAIKEKIVGPAARAIYVEGSLGIFTRLAVAIGRSGDVPPGYDARHQQRQILQFAAIQRHV